MASIVSGHTEFASPSDSEDHVIDAPTHSDGDLIFIVAAADRPNTTFSSTGFSHLSAGGDLDTSSLTGAILDKSAGASEPSTYTVSTADVVADRIGAMVFAVTDHDGLDATLVTADGDSDVATCPAITPGVDGALCLRAVMCDRDTTPLGSMTNYTKLGEIGESSGGTVAIFYRVLSGTSEEPAGTVSLNIAEQWIGATWTVAPSAVSEDALTAADLTGGTPTVDNASLGQVHSLTAGDVGSTAEIESATLGQIHSLTAGDVGSTAEIESATLGQIHSLTAADVEPTPTIDNASLGQVHVLAAVDIDSTVTIDSATLGQVHALSSTDISSTAEIESATIAQTHSLIAVDIDGGSLLIDSATIGQIHVLIAQEVTSGTPAIESAALTTEGTDGLTAADLTSGAPLIESAVIGQIHSLTAQDLTGSAAVIDSASISIIYVLIAVDISVQPAIESAALGQVHALAASELSAGVPTIDMATLASGLILIAAGRTHAIERLNRTHTVSGNRIHTVSVLGREKEI